MRHARCGFWLEITIEERRRLQREHQLNIITQAPLSIWSALLYTIYSSLINILLPIYSTTFLFINEVSQTQHKGEQRSKFEFIKSINHNEGNFDIRRCWINNYLTKFSWKFLKQKKAVMLGFHSEKRTCQHKFPRFLARIRFFFVFFFCLAAWRRKRARWVSRGCTSTHLIKLWGARRERNFALRSAELVSYPINI